MLSSLKDLTVADDLDNDLDNEYDKNAISFLRQVEHDEAERKRLEDAVLEEIVRAGKRNGYEFTVESLRLRPRIREAAKAVWRPPYH